MMVDLKRIFRLTKHGAIDESGGVRVTVALNVAYPDDACLARLRKLGLSIDRVVKNKIVGSIPALAETALEDDPDVEEVERSVRLESHALR